MTLRKSLFCFLAVSSFIGLKVAEAQNVGINTSGNAPNPNAMLDVESSNMGLLIPRMTNSERSSFGSGLGSGDEGMTVYDTDDVAYYVWDGSSWVQFDMDPTNEYNSGLSLSNDTLYLTDGGGSLSQDLSSLGGGGGGGFWSRDAAEGELYPSTVADSVGIGLQDPTANLHIKGKDVDIMDNTAALKIWEEKDGDTLYMDGDEITGGLGGGAGNENALYLQHEASEHIVMSTGPGMVGIGSGANTPDHDLHVQESSSNELVRFRNMSTGDLNATGVYAMAVESDGYGVGGEFEGGRQGVHGYVTTSSTFIPGQELAGVKGRSLSGVTDGINVGLKGRAYNSEDRNFAVHGYTLGQDANDIGADPTDYAVFGDLDDNSANTSWAGYFNGDLETTGNLISPSDRKFKKGLQAQQNVLDRLSRLEVYSYKFEQQEYMNLPRGKQYGFVAQEVEEVFPSLVHQSVFATSRPNVEEKIPKKEYKSLRYLGFIPLLTQAVKEQQEALEEKDEKIQELEEKVQKNDQELKELRSELEALKEQVN